MQLLPCAFCGSDELTETSDGFIHCHGCLVIGLKIRWNTRPSQWISVKDRLPEDKDDYVYIVTMHSHYKNKPFVEPLKYIYGQWCNMHDEELLDGEYEVTHWTPLPSPPKETK